MLHNIKFDHKPYILENVAEVDVKDIHQSVIVGLLQDGMKIFNTVDRKFSILPKNIKVNTSTHSKGVEYSFCFFTIYNKVSFIDYINLSPQEKDKFREQKFGYILVVTIGGYTFITRRNTANIAPEKLDGVTKLSKSKIDNYMSRYSTIRSAVLKSIENKNKGIMKKSYEGNDIKDDLSNMSTADSFLANIVLGEPNNPKSTTSFNEATGKFTFSSTLIEGRTLNHVVEYYKLLIANFEEDTGIDSLYSTLGNKFFNEVNFDDIVIEEYHSIMFSISDIRYLCEENQLDMMEVENILEYLSGYYELDGNEFENDDIIIQLDFTLTIPNINIIFKTGVSYDEETLDLISDIIKKDKLFTLNMVASENVVYMNGLFLKQPDSDIDLDKVMNIFESDDQLNRANSEKGKKDEYPNSINGDWSDNSLFKYIESKYLADPNNLVLCGDLGHEIADHIILNFEDKKITFIHSKSRHKDNSSYSVAQFQDLVGQATKNLGGFNINNEIFFGKIKKLFTSDISCDINGKKVQKNRIISNHDESQANDILNNFKGYPNISKELVLCINFFDSEGLTSGVFEDNFLGNQFKNIIGRLQHNCGEKTIPFKILYPEQITI